MAVGLRPDSAAGEVQHDGEALLAVLQRGPDVPLALRHARHAVEHLCPADEGGGHLGTSCACRFVELSNNARFGGAPHITARAIYPPQRVCAGNASQSGEG